MIFLHFFILLFPHYSLQVCEKNAKKCSGIGSYYNQTEGCICGKSSSSRMKYVDNLWGNQCQFGRIKLTDPKGFIVESENNYHCQSKYMFLIDSQRNLPIKFTFNEFVTECNWDHLYVFDGKSSDSPLIGAYSGRIKEKTDTETRGHKSFTTTSGAAYLYFYSDSGSFFSGFNLTYEMSSCEHSVCSFHGICNGTGQCVCDEGWSGLNCSLQECCYKKFNYQSKTKKECFSCKQPIEVPGRASHSVVLLHDAMYTFGGMSYDKTALADLNRIAKYNLPKKTWEKDLSSENPSVGTRYGHSVVSDGDNIIIFGGTIFSELKRRQITNELLTYDTKKNSWRQIETSGSMPVSHHAAVVVHGMMYVFFGYNHEHVLLNQVQKLNLQAKGTNWGKWEVIDGNTVKRRCGHTATYDQKTNAVYIFGGFVGLADQNIIGEMLIFHVEQERWTIGKSSNHRVFHSAVILNKHIVIFGGNEQVQEAVNKCYSNDCLVYSIECNEWLNSAVLNGTRRYGHSALVYNSSILVFGGFNSVFQNDVFEIDVAGDCGVYMNSDDCLKANPISDCVWERNVKKCIRYDVTLSKQSISVANRCTKHTDDCSRINNCITCMMHDNCGWSGWCQNKEELSVRNVSRPESCTEFLSGVCALLDTCFACQQHPNCSWQGIQRKCNYLSGKDKESEYKENSCFAEANTTSCYNQTACGGCLKNSQCMWCESTKECVNKKTYVVDYPYAQCLEWLSSTSGKCSEIKCSNQTDCKSCLQIPECGWCEDDSGTGVGTCMRGADNAPSEGTCKISSWKFTECPSCHCNGHSTCINGTDTCERCYGNVTGKHCNQCKHGFYGNPHNNGSCPMKCECNGHLFSCDLDGKCTCNLQGAAGFNCQRCKGGFVGDPRNGGLCFYPVKANFKYTSNFSVNTIAAFKLSNIKRKEELTFSISRISGSNGFLNLTIAYENNKTTELAKNMPFGTFKKKIKSDDYQYNSRAELIVVVFGWSEKEYMYMELVFSQSHSGFDFIQFLIMFVVCFISLLALLLIMWKVKQRYDLFINHRREKKEEIERMNRPLASCYVYMRSRDKQKTRTPTLLVLQHFKEECYSAGTFFVRYPSESQGGQCKISLGLTSVNTPHRTDKPNSSGKFLKRHLIKKRREFDKPVPV